MWWSTCEARRLSSDGADATTECLAGGAASDALQACVRVCLHAYSLARPGNARAW